MNEGDHSTYKKRTIILSWENDCHYHVEQMQRWKEALVTNAKDNHYEERLQALMDINLESNPLKLWRPWFRIDNTRDTLQGATDHEYKEILKDLIFNSGASPQETGKKKRIMLEKKQRKEEEIESWLRLVDPEDDISLEEMGNNRKAGGKLVKKRNYSMSVGKFQDAIRHENECKQKIGNKTECNRRTSFRTQRIRRTYIKILHNITFKKDDNYGL